MHTVELKKIIEKLCIRFMMGEQGRRMKLGKECKTFQVDLSCVFKN